MPQSQFASTAKPPRLSVLMPVHNGQPYLEEAIGSILSQDFADFELLILDDGSTDATPEILSRACRKDRRVRAITRAQCGLVASLNELLAQARGDLIARMDADDIALPCRLGCQAHYLDAHPEVVCVGGASMMIDGAGRYLTTLYPPEDDAAIQAAALSGHTAINHPAAMMRRKAVERVGAYDPAYYPAEDLDLWLRLGETGKLANLGIPVLKYRLHETSISARSIEQQRDAKLRACQAASRRRGTALDFTGGHAWRPAADSGSRSRFFVQYGWWAWASGERATAIYYGLRAVGAYVLNSAGWKLLLLAILRSPRKRAAVQP